MKHLIHILVCICILAILSVVFVKIDTWIPSKSVVSVPTTRTDTAVDDLIAQNQVETEPTDMPNIATTQSQANKDWLSIGESFDDYEFLAEGALRYSVTNARLVESLPDNSFIEDFLYDDFLVWIDGTGWVQQELPVYIDNDLHVQAENYLIFVDVTIESMGARCYTRSDYDDEGYSMGKYEDPYIFRSDMLYLINTDILDPLTDAVFRYNTICYFSKKDEHPEYPANHVTYRLEPGESVSFTVGYHLEKSIVKLAKRPVDLSKFCVTTSPERRAPRINLNLEGIIQ